MSPVPSGTRKCARCGKDFAYFDFEKLCLSCRAPKAPAPRERRTGPDSLSPRQRQVAELTAKGLSHKEIGARLGLATGSVKVYLSEFIYPKLGVASQGELIRYWIEKVEMPDRGDCATCCLRQAHLGGAEFPIYQ